MDNEREAVDFMYVDADIPAGITIREWRASRVTKRLSLRQTRRWWISQVRRRLTRATASLRLPDW